MIDRGHPRRAVLPLGLLGLLLPCSAQADDPPAAQSAAQPQPTPAPRRTEEPANEETGITVIGSSQRALDRTPGSVSMIRREDLRNLAPQNGGDALRTTPGVNVVSEDGMGLRLNIGIRGLDPNRSRKVLILEDGMPVSLNPYGSPELYYTPPIERMDRVEIVRGSGQILTGPQTIGGTINYITRDPPYRPTANGDLRFGTFGYLLAQAGAGATHGPVGWRLDLIHRRFAGPRRLDLALTDLSARFRLQLAPGSILRLKLNYYDEFSRATYLGPTTSQFTADPTFNAAEHDRFRVQRYAVAAMHSHRLFDGLQWHTNFYAYTTDRSWRRQEFERQDSGADYERICDPTGNCGARGASGVLPTNDGRSVYFLRSSALRDRRFWVAGLETRLTWNWMTRGILSGELIGLVRFHHESAQERIAIASSPTAESGDPRDEELRSGFALSGAVQSRFTLWRRLHLVPGLRVESFWSNRRIVRVPNTLPSGQTIGSDVNIFGETQNLALIPGMGASFDALPSLTFYTGVHRGYSPPRTKDAVSTSGQNLQLDAELSWNTELGARLRFGRWLNADLAGFLLEFENQIIPPSESGSVVSGGTFNTGHSRHAGFEGSATFDIAPLLGNSSFSLPLSLSYTWVPLASFVGGLFGGNRLPYAPEHLLYAQLRFTHRLGFTAQVGFSFTGSQYADKENTVFPSADGLVGELPAFATLDARVAYQWRRTGLTFSLTGRNLTDQVYVGNRAPQGIQPAGYRQVFVGIEWVWPGT